jgi:hypothetical protein
MPSYHVLNIDDLGQLDFYASMGAMAEFEDKHGVLVNDILTNGKIGMSLAIKLAYECHLVACIRLDKNPIEYEKFKAFSGMEVLTLTTTLINDLIVDATKGEQKKTTKKA